MNKRVKLGIRGGGDRVGEQMEPPVRCRKFTLQILLICLIYSKYIIFFLPNLFIFLCIDNGSDFCFVIFLYLKWCWNCGQ